MTQQMPTIRQALSHAKNLLCNIENGHAEARWLLQKSTGLDNHELILNMDNTIEHDSLDTLHRLIERRLSGEPVQYLLENWDFYGISFAVGYGVLIPRPETELVVDKALGFLKKLKSTPKILDICSGSGAIPIAIAKNLPNIDISAIELSEDALIYLKKNADAYEVDINILKCDVLTVDANEFDSKFDLITANPPYICSNEVLTLDTELHFEPKMALDGGEDGLMFYKKIIPLATQILNSGGALVLEIGCEQGADVMKLMQNYGFKNIAIHKDFSNLDRVVYGEYIN